MTKKRPPRAIWPLVAWDLVWKVVAIRRAVQLRQYRMIPVLAITSSAGLLPIGYLVKTRSATRAEDDGGNSPAITETF
jgi:hypothetical protein